MQYVSKGAVSPDSTVKKLTINLRGVDHILSGEEAALWLDGQFAVRELSEYLPALKRLNEIGLVEATDEFGALGQYRLLTSCIIVPVKQKLLRQRLTATELLLWQWIGKASLRLTVAELVCLADKGVHPEADLLGAENRQALESRICMWKRNCNGHRFRQSRLVLKKPKTESSIRKVWIPKTLAYILVEYRKTQDNLREMLGEEYFDSNLVVALPNGRPCEERLITEAFQRLREKCELPNVVFHSLRHSSTTYKLKLNKGDIKATQGDTGHARADMITRVYAHILDEDRKVNAVKMEHAFYSPLANPDLRAVRPPSEDDSDDLNLDAFIAKLKTASPDKLAVLAQLLRA
ncbi:MAG: hypothetical protein LBJ12_02670 [Oscillospiraceae bacterium]|nr:hypothetical protein [Oscillospiraceae bacterium]